ncbi:ankyrin repeat domain-containing protein 40-like [Hylaeus volcanicus]|uniref:ankyrin repeat domain-containing protein 40-like n=1 Tax=Hylaeus volcanicus TaxID=313075 RepID=UPI0023B780CF|nr:ankyrin repeat domain-containing protein 40-like [Hylaeus volcanicus]XP_053975194.1 ankyrin repeat domain-containing protein 40-like [Hylaeus volcanicus]
MEKHVKLIDFLSTLENTESKRMLEDYLRKAAFVGNTDVVQKLLKLGVDVNARDPVDGWTSLHLACEAGYCDVVVLLLKNGADKNIISINGETPASLCTNPEIVQLLGASMDQLSLNDSTAQNTIPNYLKHDFVHGTVESSISKVRSNGLYPDELVLKIRVADAPDPDFIEIELPQSNLTYQALIRVCCQELNIDPNQIVKLRKLPNTKLRKDEDIQRLRNFQEIEVVTNTVNTCNYVQNTNDISNNISTTPANGYQSISKKDQTILY